MVANAASIELSLAAETLQMAGRMEAQAHNADWHSVEKLAVRIRRRLFSISEAERRELIEAILKSIERVQTLALVSRHDVSDKLAELQRGRVAVREYDQFAVQTTATALR